ncbi:GGDEF domain-containing protein [Paraglaciecola sp. 2405UD69-4]|uniref:GGDEF domain-containing protein n=1 Tax=Paraglaciecola sp. 2405UD69-4 TaxID=3391836 RepID=UPI0039C9C31D
MIKDKVFENVSPDMFQAGFLITDENRQILYANRYFFDEFQLSTDKIVGTCSDNIFTHSSRIFCESYLMPLLIHEGRCEEMQLALLDGNNKRISIIVSARMDKEKRIYWSFFNASKRDQLYDELIETRKELEAQTKILQSLSSTDELTGLTNRREFNLRAPELINQAKRNGHSYVLFIVDIDFFKKINDSFGHLEGDRVLKEFGAQLQSFGRETDLVARFGGEEFIVLLPNINIEDAKVLASRLHSLISKIQVNHTPITVSIGAVLSDASQSLHEVTQLADDALYQAKNSGRNKTVFS